MLSQPLANRQALIGTLFLLLELLLHPGGMFRPLLQHRLSLLLGPMLHKQLDIFGILLRVVRRLRTQLRSLLTSRTIGRTIRKPVPLGMSLSALCPIWRLESLPGLPNCSG